MTTWASISGTMDSIPNMLSASITKPQTLSQRRGSNTHVDVVWLSSCSIGTIFGAIHFLSWHSAFPTPTQLLLWRISSVVLVAEPFCLALEKALSFAFGDDTSVTTWRKAVASTLFIFFLPSMILGPLVYILARMALLVLAFLTVRNPPSTAFQTISWTTYIPHL
ncbi:hypothetical protein BDN72DRAFT_901942 [Pluteus cervinus]|uniref:Uncharacterized protein n=1 Tax=Pluteus cervinus TaxID=181527 RepID=A0ACD3AF43_9AGAR|nr:hypothetical protein BDN72DRAFT_901942 [Pluteus cervinus]